MEKIGDETDESGDEVKMQNQEYRTIKNFSLSVTASIAEFMAGRHV